MNSVRALRLTRAQVCQHVAARRMIATTAHPSLMSSASSFNASAASANAQPVVPLSNIEAQWEILTEDDKFAVQEQLDEIQKKDWNALSLDEKKAAYFVAFGPHGPRAPTSNPGDTLKIVLSVAGLCGAAGVLKWGFAQFAQPPPHTMNKEWQEASTEYAKQQKINPISGVSSEGYSGKGFVQSK